MWTRGMKSSVRYICTETNTNVHIKHKVMPLDMSVNVMNKVVIFDIQSRVFSHWRVRESLVKWDTCCSCGYCVKTMYRTCFTHTGYCKGPALCLSNQSFGHFDVSLESLLVTERCFLWIVLVFILLRVIKVTRAGSAGFKSELCRLSEVTCFYTDKWTGPWTEPLLVLSVSFGNIDIIIHILLYVTLVLFVLSQQN